MEEFSNGDIVILRCIIFLKYNFRLVAYGFSPNLKCLIFIIKTFLRFLFVPGFFFLSKKIIITYTLVIFRGRAEGTPLSHFM